MRTTTGGSVKDLMSNWRWWICSLLFFATTINYMDRQVLSLTYEEFIKPQFHWTDADYGTVTGFFSIFYAFACLFAGKFIDWIGTRKGYIISIIVWSVGACMHAFCGVAALKVSGLVALSFSTVSVYLFLLCRGVLALGESGNFPAAIKVTAEYFPKKDRAFATSIFNAGASVGALVAPLCIPPLAKALGWEWAFIIIGGLGFVWVFFWILMYKKPEESKQVNQAELEYIHQDDAEEAAEKAALAQEKSIPMLQCLKYRQAWAVILGKFFSDGVWWFFLFWAPSYFDNQFGAKSTTALGQLLLITLYSISSILSIFGGYLPKFFVEKKGMHPFDGRMRSMLIFAFFPMCALLAQPLVAGHTHRPLRRRTPGLERQYVQHSQRPLPEEHHRHPDRNGIARRRHRDHGHPEDRGQPLHLRGERRFRIHLHGIRRQACRLLHHFLLLRRGLPHLLGGDEGAHTQVQARAALTSKR